MQAALQIRENLGSTVELGVQVVWDVLANETFEKAVDAGKIKATLATRKRRLRNSIALRLRYLLHVHERKEHFEHALAVHYVLSSAIVFDDSLHVFVQVGIVFEVFCSIYVLLHEI